MYLFSDSVRNIRDRVSISHFLFLDVSEGVYSLARFFYNSFC